MSLRIFPEETISANGTRVRAAKITCLGCGTAGYYVHKRGVVRRPPEAVAEHFRGMNWTFGSDWATCPDCSRRRCGKRKGTVLDMKARDAKKNGPVVDVVVAATSRPPNFEERQLINMRLMDVYASPETGYRAGFTDARVAKDLGCPREWVAAIRDAVFGPEGSSEAVEKCLSACDSAERSFITVGETQMALFRRVNEVRAEIDKWATEARAEFSALAAKMDDIRVMRAAITEGGGR